MESKKNEKIEHLKSMVAIPNLYISDYFINLRNEFDKIYMQKRITNKNQEVIQDKQEWEDIINKITLNEKECLANLSKKRFSDQIKKEINEKIELIEQRFNNDEDVEADLLAVTYKVKKILFSNKTVTLIKNANCKYNRSNAEYIEDEDDEEDNEQDDEQNDEEDNEEIKTTEVIDYNLLIIEDQYFDDQEIETAVEKSEEALTNQFLKMKILKNKIDISKRINEISLNIEKLEALDLSSRISGYYNSIDVKLALIEVNAFTEFTNLRSLNLFNNKITSIQAYTFQQLSSLENLWLNNNLIYEIDNKAFNGLHNLNWLDLSDNQIVSIDALCFDEIKSLETLDLENNYIRDIEPLMFQNLSKLKNLRIQNNPFINKLVLRYTTNPITSKSVPIIQVQTDFSQFLNKNLLKNSNAENGFNFWSKSDHENIQNLNKADDIKNALKKYIMKPDKNLFVDNLWKIETDQYGAHLSLYKEDKTLFKNFVTTHSLGEKYQIIDLLSEGINEYFMEKYKPDIEVGEHFTARNDCGSIYHLSVYLINECFEVLDKYSYEETFQQWSEADWKIATHKFNYDSSKKSVRYILFYHSGKDTQFWDGFYGSKMTNGFVRLLPFKDEIPEAASANL